MVLQLFILTLTKLTSELKSSQTETRIYQDYKCTSCDIIVEFDYIVFCMFDIPNLQKTNCI